MNDYEAKQEAKRARLKAAAGRAEDRAAAAFKRADLREDVSGIPFGQPILVGHHSEGRHRAAIKRADNAMRAGINAAQYADELRARAEAVGTGGISSDDPDAPTKLMAEIDEAKARQEQMKRTNADWRKEGNKGGRQSDGTWRDQPFPPYMLTNNSANIRRMELRLAQINTQRAKAAECPRKSTSYEGFGEVVENAEENRLQIVFEDKPSAEVRDILKSRGFRWSPSQKAWQRQLNNAARFAANCVLRECGVTTDAS